MDWAMKFLPMSFREKQSDWFAQKGINWHVTVCVYKTADQKLKHRTFTHCLEGTKQDANAVAVLLEHTLKTIKDQLPGITTAYLRSDNAGCYHCGSLWFSIPSISRTTGIKVKRYDFSESQSGKSYCDAKIAHMRSKIRKSVADGRNVVCAADMKTAIDECGGVTGCQTAHVEVSCSNAKTPTLIKGISKITNVEFTDDDQLILWKAYGIGEGRRVTIPSSENETKRDFMIHADFTAPRNIEGDLKHVPSEEGKLNCPVGCCEVFKSFSAMYDHCLVGRHVFHLQKMSTFDNIKLRWYDTCMNVTEGMAKIQMSAEASLDKESHDNVEKGWALKKDKKHVRFRENVKVYLRQLFEDGERTGVKMNACAVAKTMRVVQENGKRKFSANECLEPSQITSFFSRLAAEKKTSSKTEEDIDAAIAVIEKLEALEEVFTLLS